MLPLWLPWAHRRVGAAITPEVERQVLSISARQIDRCLAATKRAPSEPKPTTP